MTKPLAPLLVVGSVALDDVDGPFGPHPGVLGGSASFVTTAASYLTDGAVQLVAVIGDDFPEEHVTFLDSRGVDLTGLERVAGKTFHWSGRYSDDLTSRESLDTQLGVFADFRPKLSDAHRDAQLVFLGNIHPALQVEVLDQIRAPKLVAADTMNFWIDGELDALKKMLARIDLIIINDEEARQLSGVHSLVKAAEIIRDMGPRGIVIKRGDAGALLFFEKDVFFAPALPLGEVRDPTGAGDTFAGGFMGYLSRVGEVSPLSIRHAIVYGSVMASFCVEDFSLDALRKLTSEQIDSRYAAFHSLARFEQQKL